MGLDFADPVDLEGPDVSAAPVILETPIDERPDPSTCVVLVPMRDFPERECSDGLSELRARGYEVREVAGHSAIDFGRCVMAGQALQDGFEEIMWIDSDVGFRADDVEMLRQHRLPLVTGIYPQKGRRALATHLMPDTDKLVFGVGGGLVEVLYAAAGFMLTRRDAYERIREHEKLPTCNARFGFGFAPYFLPMVIPDGEDDNWYLAEDYAFCERARRSGIPVMADTRIRLHHVGKVSYTWEDAGSERPRYASYTFNVN
jgi:hypothetical protein